MTREQRGAVEDGEVLHVDLGGLPTTWPVRQGRILRWVWAAMVLLGAVQLFRRVTGDMDVVVLVTGALQVLFGALMLVVLRTVRVQLEPEGYRLGDVLYRGRLRSWAQVREIRPGNSRWGTHVEIRALTASPAPVPLHGMSEEQALDLQQRLSAARADAGSSLGPEQGR